MTPVIPHRRHNVEEGSPAENNQVGNHRREGQQEISNHQRIRINYMYNYVYIYIPNRYNIIIIKVEIVSASQGQMLTPSFQWLQYAMAAVVGFLWLL
jgi:hypothetical protein